MYACGLQGLRQQMLIAALLLVLSLLAVHHSHCQDYYSQGDTSSDGNDWSPVDLGLRGQRPRPNRPAPASAPHDLGQWYNVDKGGNQCHWNFKDEGNGRMSMTIKPTEEAVRINSNNMYTGGKFEFKVKSAAVMPGVITAVYLASGDGRRSDEQLGQQDEIDLEWKGNDPSRVQTNVFLNGQEDLQLIAVGGDSSQSEKLYAVEWSGNTVSFWIDGRVVRSKQMYRPLQPMRLHMAVWTTDGGWPGVIQWGGKTDWYGSGRNGQPAVATFQILSLPY